MALPLLRTLYGRGVVAMALYIKTLRIFGGLSADKFQLRFWNDSGGNGLSRGCSRDAVDWLGLDCGGYFLVAKIIKRR